MAIAMTANPNKTFFIVMVLVLYGPKDIKKHDKPMNYKTYFFHIQLVMKTLKYCRIFKKFFFKVQFDRHQFYFGIICDNMVFSRT
ncbi:MAG: hypothetical protein CMH48_04830 [Muricauda sp.]|nr:hypothetical protein [Allomuricauda sp.]|tara:strand:+ start:23849 stop:24103 length:255 start_codon:yes stop_codon:yes gene_type:complete